jgi:hypothetical protein
MDVLIMPVPPPQIDPDGNIVVTFSVSTQASPNHPALQFSTTVLYQYGATQPQKVTAIRTAAFTAYQNVCVGRGYTPLPLAQIRSEVVGVT